MKAHVDYLLPISEAWMKKSNPTFYWSDDDDDVVHEERDRFDDLTKLLRAVSGHQHEATVSVNGNAVIEADVRKTRKVCDIHVSAYDGRHTFDEMLQSIIPPYYAVTLHCSPYSELQHQWDMLIYGVGDHFKRHSDGKISERHLATVLLIAPQSVSPHSGGDLVIYSRPDESVITAHATKWRVVLFPPNVEHQVLPVTSGQRIVFKTHYEIPKSSYQLLTVDEQDAIPSSFDIEDYLVDEDDETYSHYRKIIKKISDRRCRVGVVVMERFYSTPKLANLIEDDAVMVCMMKEHFKNASFKMMNVDVEHNMDDDLSDYDSTVSEYSNDGFPNVFKHMIYTGSYGEDDETIKIQHQDPNSMPGKLLSHGPVYNDNTYDTVYMLKVTCLIVIKHD